MKNLILVGMPACGKSTLGVLLAKSLGYDFIDTDLVLQLQRKEPLQTVINKEGIEQFLRYEERALLSVKAKRNTVIATGGSAVFSEKGMRSLLENGICVYIRVSIDDLRKRLTNIKTRGIAAGPGESLKDILKIREPLYEKYADYKVDSSGAPELMVNKIIYLVDDSLYRDSKRDAKKGK